MIAKGPWKLASRFEKATDGGQCVAGSDSVHGVPEMAEHGAAEVMPPEQSMSHREFQMLTCWVFVMHWSYFTCYAPSWPIEWECSMPL